MHSELVNMLEIHLNKEASFLIEKAKVLPE